MTPTNGTFWRTFAIALIAVMIASVAVAYASIQQRLGSVESAQMVLQRQVQEQAVDNSNRLGRLEAKVDILLTRTER